MSYEGFIFCLVDFLMLWGLHIREGIVFRCKGIKEGRNVDKGGLGWGRGGDVIGIGVVLVVGMGLR